MAAAAGGRAAEWRAGSRGGTLLPTALCRRAVVARSPCSALEPVPVPPAPLPARPQVSGPADASNFDAAQNTQHAKRNSRYISTGVFKDF